MKTRIAPSPTGKFHLGTLRTALFNYLLSKSNDGVFILRIDDTDLSRNNDSDIDFIHQQMKHFGLDYDVTFNQSSRLDRYKQVATALGFKKDDGTLNVNMGDYDMVILRDNGYPTYNFASILDDYDYDITDIIRGVDHITNLPKQQTIWDMICNVYGQKQFPNVQHAGLLFYKGAKLSKRTGNCTTDDYNDYDVDALLNWLFKFGWSHPNANFDKDFPILKMGDMVKHFPNGHIVKSNSSIDINKLMWLNKKHKNMKTTQSGGDRLDA
jgi:glutamyl/glutaminyl-tRNA synthetase